MLRGWRRSWGWILPVLEEGVLDMGTHTAPHLHLPDQSTRLFSHLNAEQPSQSLEARF